jgi:hypothetical protein
LQHSGQRRHRRAADADEMYVLRFDLHCSS